jgi:hypothetical protein
MPDFTEEENSLAQSRYDCQIRSGDIAGAKATLEIALSFHKRNFEFAKSKTDTEKKNAKEMLVSTLAKFAEFHIQHEKNLELAENYVTEAIEVSPDSGYVHYCLANVLFLAERPKEAKIAYLRSQERGFTPNGFDTLSLMLASF